MSPDQESDDQTLQRLAVGPVPGAQSDLRGRLLAAQPGRPRKAVLVRHLTHLAAQVLDAAPNAIDPTAPLATLGLTSAGILEMRARLESSLQLTLPATVGWQFPTLEALASHLAQRLGNEAQAVASQATAADVRTGTSVLPGQDAHSSARGTAAAGFAETRSDLSLDELSDEELAVLLLAKIEQMGEAEQR